MNADPESLRVKQEDLAENSAAAQQADEPVPSSGDATALAPLPRVMKPKRPAVRLYTDEEVSLSSQTRSDPV